MWRPIEPTNFSALGFVFEMMSACWRGSLPSSQMIRAMVMCWLLCVTTWSRPAMKVWSGCVTPMHLTGTLSTSSIATTVRWLNHGVRSAVRKGASRSAFLGSENTCTDGVQLTRQ